MRPPLAVPPRFLLAVAFCLALLPRAEADTPRPTDPPEGGTKVRLVEQDISLLLRGLEGGDAELAVEATLTFRREGGSQTLETGFPAHEGGTLEDIAVRIDDAEVEVILLKREETWWYVWDARYPGGRDTTHVISYRVPLPDMGKAGSATYALAAGGAWAEEVERTRVTLRTAGDIALDQFTALAPQGGGRRTDNAFVWEFEKFEPDVRKNVHFSWGARTWRERRRELEGLAVRDFSARRNLVALLEAWPARNLRRKHDHQEASDWLDALAALLAEREVEDDRITLPLRDAHAPRPRSYVTNPLPFMENARRALVAATRVPRPPARAAEIRDAWLATYDAWKAGRLFAGVHPIPYPQDGRQAKRARSLDAAIEDLR